MPPHRLLCVQARDPDMVVGWEMEAASIGYLCERGRHLLEERHNLAEREHAEAAAAAGRAPPPAPPPTAAFREAGIAPADANSGMAARQRASHGAGDTAQARGPGRARGPPGAPGVGEEPSPFDIARAFSRSPLSEADPRNEPGRDAWGVEHGSGGVWLAGRVIMNVWRLMRDEVGQLAHHVYDSSRGSRVVWEVKSVFV